MTTEEGPKMAFATPVDPPARLLPYEISRTITENGDEVITISSRTEDDFQVYSSDDPEWILKAFQDQTKNNHPAFQEDW